MKRYCSLYVSIINVYRKIFNVQFGHKFYLKKKHISVRKDK